MAALSSCGSPAGGANRPAAEPESPANEELFARIGSRSISDVVAAASFAASRCLFQDGSTLTHVPMASSLRKAPPGAREELNALLAALQRARTAGEKSPTAPQDQGPQSRRIYQLHPQGDWIIDLSLAELPGAAGRLQATCNLRNKGENEIAVTTTAPMLVKFLREEAAAALLSVLDPVKEPAE